MAVNQEAKQEAKQDYLEKERLERERVEKEHVAERERVEKERVEGRKWLGDIQARVAELEAKRRIEPRIFQVGSEVNNELVYAAAELASLARRVDDLIVHGLPTRATPTS